MLFRGLNEIIPIRAISTWHKIRTQCMLMMTISLFIIFFWDIVQDMGKGQEVDIHKDSWNNKNHVLAPLKWV